MDGNTTWDIHAAAARDAVAQWRDGGVPDTELLDALNAIERLNEDVYKFRNFLKSTMLRLAGEGRIVYREKGDNDG